MAGKESVVVPIAKVDYRIFGRTLGLAVEQVGYGCDSIKLESLIGVEKGKLALGLTQPDLITMFQTVRFANQAARSVRAKCRSRAGWTCG